MKRKILCLMLATLMLVSLIPATVISAAGAALLTAAESGSELDESNAAIVVLNAEGEPVGYYNALGEADAALGEGYTLKLLRDITLTKKYEWGASRPKFVELNYAEENDSTAEKKVTSGEGTYYSELPENPPITYTVDGNGYRIISTADSDFAMTFCRESQFDDVTLKNVTLVAPRGGIHATIGSGGKMMLTLVDCKIYAGNMYWMVNPDFYDLAPTLMAGDCLSQGYVGINCEIKGADTEFFAYSSFVVWSAGIVSIYDGTFYSAKGTAAVCQASPEVGYSNQQRHTFIYGGTFVCGGGEVLRVCDGSRMFVMGGKFITNSSDVAAVAGTSDTNFGDMYVYGGEFYAKGAIFKSFAKASIQVGKTLYYTDLETGAISDRVMLPKTSKDDLISTEPISVTVPCLGGENGETTLSFGYSGMVAVDVSDSIAESSYDVGIFDAEGQTVAYLNLTDTAREALFAKVTSDALGYSADFMDLLNLSFYITPEGGTWRLLRNVTYTHAGNNGTKAMTNINGVHFTMTGPMENGVDLPATLYTNEAAYTLTIDNKGYYFWYSNAGNVTLENINLINNTGRGIELGNGTAINKSSMTIGMGATVVAGAGSAFYLGKGSNLNIEGGVVAAKDKYTSYCDLIQLRSGVKVTMTDGLLYLPQNANGNATGFVFKHMPESSRRTVDINSIMKAVYTHLPTDTAVSLMGGRVVTGMKADRIIYALGPLDFTMNASVEAADGEVPQQATKAGVVTVLDTTGTEVITVDSFEAAKPYIKDGYTLRLNADYTPTQSINMINFGVSFTIDGQGYTLGSSEAAPAITGYVLTFGGWGDVVTVNNLKIRSKTGGIGLYQHSDCRGDTQVNLHNTDIAVGSGHAVYMVDGFNLFYVRITGADTKMSSTDGVTIWNRGMMDIYAGTFTTTNGAYVVETMQTDTENNADEYNFATLTTYGGTFTGGATSKAVIRARGGSAFVVVDGKFYNKNASGYVGVFGKAGTDGNAFVYIVGGTFYHAGTTNAFSYGTNTAKDQVRLVLYRGTFHQNGTGTFTAYTSTAQYTEWYTPRRPTLYAASTDVFTKVSSVTASSVSGYAKTWSVGFDSSKGTADSAWEVTVPLTGKTYTFNGCELEAAMHAVGDGGEMRLTKTITYSEPTRTVATLDENKAVTGTTTKSAYGTTSHGHHRNFEWTITSKQNTTNTSTEIYTLNGSVSGMYIFWFYGGTVNIENIIIQNTAGRTIQTNSLENDFGLGVLNIGDGGTVIGHSECAIFVANRVIVNVGNKDNEAWGGSAAVYATTTASGDTGIIKLSGGSFNLYDKGYVGCKPDGTVQGAMNAIATANPDPLSTVRIYGGKVKANTTNAINLTTNAYVYINGGTIEGANSTAISGATSDDLRTVIALIRVQKGFVRVGEKGFTISTANPGYYTFDMVDSGSVEVNGGTYSVVRNFVHASNNATGSLVINGGKFVNSTNGNDIVNTRGGSHNSVTINGGYFENSSGGNVMKANEGASTTKWTFNGGEFKKTGTSRMFKFMGCQTVVFNGGTYYTAASDIMAIESDSCKANVTINAGVKMETTNESIVQVAASSVGATLTVNGGDFKHTGTTDDWLFQLDDPDSTYVFNGGSYYSGNPLSDAMISVGGGTCTVNGGYYASKALCVLRTLGGKTESSGNPNKTAPTTESTAVLNVNNGYFVLLEGAKTNSHASLIRCGGGSTYGTVNLKGGVYVNECSTSQQGINLVNGSATCNMTGGTYLTAKGQSFYSWSCNDNQIYATYTAYSAKKGTLTYNGTKYDYYTVDGKAPAFSTQAASDTAKAGELVKGAQVRLVESSSGLRFISHFNAATVTALEALGTVEYGTLIAPTVNVMQAGSFTKAALDAAGVAYADIAADKGLVDDNEGGVYLRAALVNIKAANWARSFSTVAYAKVIAADGTATYYYTAYNMTDNVRSIKQVATAALADVYTPEELAADSTLVGYYHQAYTFEGTTATEKTGYRSRYTQAQQQALAAYLA